MKKMSKEGDMPGLGVTFAGVQFRSPIGLMWSNKKVHSV